jgi:hypothetical protein
VTTSPKHTRLPLLLAVMLAAVLTAGCAAAPVPVEHTVKVQDATDSRPISAAAVKAEIDLRYAVEGVTGSDGSVTLTFDPFHLELHNWTKLTVTAADYVTQTLLAQVEPGSAPTVVELLPVGAEPPAAKADQPPAETSPEAAPPAETEATAGPRAGQLLQRPPGNEHRPGRQLQRHYPHRQRRY